MKEYKEDDELQQIDPQKVDKDNESLWRIITVPAEIEFFLLKRNQIHFGQSEHEFTPFMTEIYWDTSIDEAEEILNGTYNNNRDAELSKIIKLVLPNCVQIAPLEKTSPEITVQQLRGKMKVWRNLTTTSSSGRHLGHYKCLFTVINKSLKVEERKEFKEIQEKIADCYVAIINYAICHNYSYKRWKQILNFMIYKEQGNMKIHQLPVIHIYEADYNVLVGVVQRKTIQHAQQLREID